METARQKPPRRYSRGRRHWKNNQILKRECEKPGLVVLPTVDDNTDDVNADDDSDRTPECQRIHTFFIAISLKPILSRQKVVDDQCEKEKRKRKKKYLSPMSRSSPLYAKKNNKKKGGFVARPCQRLVHPVFQNNRIDIQRNSIHRFVYEFEMIRPFRRH